MIPLTPTDSAGTARESQWLRMQGIPFVATAAALPMLTVGAAILVLGLFVFARERASEVTVSFFVLAIVVSVWLFSIGAMIAAASAGTALVLARAAYVGIALIPAAVLHFSLALLAQTRRRRGILAGAWAACVGWLLLFTRTSVLLTGVRHFRWGFYPRLSPSTASFLIFFAIALGGSLVLLTKTPPRSEQERRRTVSLAIALAVGYLGSVDFIPTFGIDLYPVGCFAVLGFIVLAARAVLKFRLADLSASFVADRLLQTMHGGVIVVDTEGFVRLTNHVAAHLLGWTVDEMVDRDLRDILGVSILPVTDSDSFCRRSSARNHIVAWRRRDGAEVEISLSASALRDDAGHAVGILYALSDVSDRRRAEANEYGATHDLLTRLPNRIRFYKAFEEEKERIVASGRIPAVLFLDLDGFKAVNDRDGHNVGDALLQLVAARLRNAIRGTDLIARFGGDEFVLMLDLARVEDVTFVAEKLLRIVSGDYMVDNLRVSIGVSIGAAFFPTHGRSAEELVRAADAGMYAAKRGGKGRLEIAAPRGEKQAARDDTPAPPPFNVDARA